MNWYTSLWSGKSSPKLMKLLPREQFLTGWEPLK